MGQHHEEERERNYEEEESRSRQRRPISNSIGFNRNALIPKGQSGYEPPDLYPTIAQLYLEALSRIGTMSGAAKLAGSSVNKIYEFRLHLEGFIDEEEAAKDAMTDCLEENLFDAAFTEVGMARVRALEVALKAKRRSYNPKQEHEISGEVNVTWLDLLKQAEQEKT